LHRLSPILNLVHGGQRNHHTHRRSAPAAGAAPAAGVLIGGVAGEACRYREPQRGRTSGGAASAAARQRAGKRQADGHEAGGKRQSAVKAEEWWGLGMADGGATASAATLGGALPRMAGCGRRCAARMRTASPSPIVLVSRRRRYCQLGMEFDAVKHRFLTFLFFRSSSQPLCDVSLGRGVLITC
jgi:hypothetical protein